MNAGVNNRLKCLIRNDLLSFETNFWSKKVDFKPKTFDSNQFILFLRQIIRQVIIKQMATKLWNRLSGLLRNGSSEVISLKPDYADSGRVGTDYNLIKTEDQIKGITTSCIIAQNILTKVGQQLKVFTD